MSHSILGDTKNVRGTSAFSMTNITARKYIADAATSCMT